MAKINSIWSRTNSGDYLIHEVDDDDKSKDKKLNCIYFQQLKINGENLPITKYLNKGFYIGSSILINGFIQTDVDKLTINLLNDNEDDIVFHVNPRFYENEIVRNTLKNGDWGEEERSGGFPLIPGSYVSLKINCEKKGFEIYINEKLFATYDHRIKPKNITHVEIEGEIKLDLVLYKTIVDDEDDDTSSSSDSESDEETPVGFQSVTPTILTSIWAGTNNDNKFLIHDPHYGNPNEIFDGFYLKQLKIKDDDIPMKIKFDKNFIPGSSIIINGYIESDAERLDFNLFTKEKINGDKVKNIAFHFNPRFTEYEIIRNTFENDDWGEEERSGGFPLKTDNNFSLKIDCETQGFRVFIDGKEFTYYYHRIPTNNIHKIELEGGMIVHSAFYKSI